MNWILGPNSGNRRVECPFLIKMVFWVKTGPLDERGRNLGRLQAPLRGPRAVSQLIEGSPCQYPSL